MNSKTTIILHNGLTIIVSFLLSITLSVTLGYWGIDIYYSYVYKDLDLKALNIDTPIPVYVDKESEWGNRYNDVIEDTLSKVPESLTENLPKRIVLAADDKFQNMVPDAAGYAGIDGTVVIRDSVIDLSTYPEISIRRFLKKVFYHEIGHIILMDDLRNKPLHSIVDVTLPPMSLSAYLPEYSTEVGWSGPDYFDYILPTEISKTAAITEYGRTDIFEDYSEAFAYILSGQSHLISETRVDYFKEHHNLDPQSFEEGTFPLPLLKFSPLDQTNVVLFGLRDKVYEYQTSFLYTQFMHFNIQTEEELNEYVLILDKLEERGFEISKTDGLNTEVSYDNYTYYISIYDQGRPSPRSSTFANYDIAVLVGLEPINSNSSIDE